MLFTRPNKENQVVVPTLFMNKRYFKIDFEECSHINCIIYFANNQNNPKYMNTFFENSATNCLTCVSNH